MTHCPERSLRETSGGAAIVEDGGGFLLLSLVMLLIESACSYRYDLDARNRGIEEGGLEERGGGAGKYLKEYSTEDHTQPC
jgi:hypothetical protein